MKKEVMEGFWLDRDETGRQMEVSYKTGIRYYIEPLGNGRPADWGSYNPSTGNIENKKGFGKCTGSVLPSESIVTEDNGFKNVAELGIGTSYRSEIDKRDAIHYANGVRPKTMNNGN